MTVKDLIKKLRAFDQDVIVVTRGMDEAGYADIHVVEPVLMTDRSSEAARQALGEYVEAGIEQINGIQAILIDHG